MNKNQGQPPEDELFTTSKEDREQNKQKRENILGCALFFLVLAIIIAGIWWGIYVTSN